MTSESKTDTIVPPTRYCGLPVTNLEQSVKFYRDIAGLSVEVDSPEPGTAILDPKQGYAFILADTTGPTWETLLGPDPIIMRPTDAIFVGEPAFDDRLRQLEENQARFTLHERSWGDRIIELIDPDGYKVTFWMIWERSRNTVIEQLTMGRQGLRAEIEQLDQGKYYLRPEPASWCIAEVVHHLADIDLTTFHVIRATIAEPGKAYRPNPFDQNHYAAALRYRDRPIEPSLQLFEAIRDLLLDMLETIPDAWDRTVQTDFGETNVETYVQMMATHTLEHIQQIKGIRSALRVS